MPRRRRWALRPAHRAATSGPTIAPKPRPPSRILIPSIAPPAASIPRPCTANSRAPITVKMTQLGPTIIARTVGHAHPNREAGLQLAHPRSHFMSVNLPPHIRRPVLVKLARIFDEENVIGVNLEVAALNRTDRKRIGLALE